VKKSSHIFHFRNFLFFSTFWFFSFFFVFLLIIFQLIKYVVNVFFLVIMFIVLLKGVDFECLNHFEFFIFLGYGVLWDRNHAIRVENNSFIWIIFISAKIYIEHLWSKFVDFLLLKLNLLFKFFDDLDDYGHILFDKGDDLA
jgi:hypothetical protein